MTLELNNEEREVVLEALRALYVTDYCDDKEQEQAAAALLRKVEDLK